MTNSSSLSDIVVRSNGFTLAGCVFPPFEIKRGRIYEIYCATPDAPSALATLLVGTDESKRLELYEPYAVIYIYPPARRHSWATNRGPNVEALIDAIEREMSAVNNVAFSTVGYTANQKLEIGRVLQSQIRNQHSLVHIIFPTSHPELRTLQIESEVILAHGVCEMR